MAKQVDQRIIGVDVAKGWLDICDTEQGEATRIDNTGKGIDTWLRSLLAPARIAVEATNRCHERFVEQADAQGHRFTSLMPSGYPDTGMLWAIGPIRTVAMPSCWRGIYSRNMSICDDGSLETRTRQGFGGY